MGCEHTKKERIKWLGARPSEIVDADSRRLVTMHPHLLQDRVDILEPHFICGEGIGADLGECQVALCREPSEFECDGCDLPICRGHANNRGTQTIVAETSMMSPGWQRFSYEDTFDLCPFCLFNPEKSRKAAGHT